MISRIKKLIVFTSVIIRNFLSQRLSEWKATMKNVIIFVDPPPYRDPKQGRIAG